MVCMCVQLNILCVLYVGVLERVHSGDGYDLASTLCRYTLRKGNLFVLSWRGCDEQGGEVSLDIC